MSFCMLKKSFFFFSLLRNYVIFYAHRSHPPNPTTIPSSSSSTSPFLSPSSLSSWSSPLPPFPLNTPKPGSSPFPPPPPLLLQQLYHQGPNTPRQNPPPIPSLPRASTSPPLTSLDTASLTTLLKFSLGVDFVSKRVELVRNVTLINTTMSTKGAFFVWALEVPMVREVVLRVSFVFVINKG